MICTLGRSKKQRRTKGECLKKTKFLLNFRPKKMSKNLLIRYQKSVNPSKSPQSPHTKSAKSAFVKYAKIGGMYAFCAVKMDAASR